MTTKWFFGVETVEELKKTFHKLAVKLHPDNGGNSKDFINMKSEFEKLFDVLKNVHLKKDGTTWEATGEKATAETAGEFMDIIEKLMFIDELTVEICGSWVWVGGDTKTYKDMLKEMGFRYSANKKMWYYHRQGRTRYFKGRKAWEIEEIRNVYGSEQYKGTRAKLEETA